MTKEMAIYCRVMTGRICARELKIPFNVEVIKCPLKVDKQKIEFPALPKSEFAEVVVTVQNTSHEDYMVEIVPPNKMISGLTVNPLVKSLEPGKSTLVSIKYDSQFRDLSHRLMKEMNNPLH